MTNYKQLCAELVDDLELCDWPYKLKEAIRADIDRARAELAEPEPEGPTDEELNSLWNCCGIADEHGHHEGNFFDFARAVLARWGNRQEMLDSSPADGEVAELVAWLLDEAIQAANASQPTAAGKLTWAAQLIGEHAELLQRQAPEPEGLTDEQLREIWNEGWDTSEEHGAFKFARAVLARWGK